VSFEYLPILRFGLNTSQGLGVTGLRAQDEGQRPLLILKESKTHTHTQLLHTQCKCYTAVYTKRVLRFKKAHTRVKGSRAAE